MKLWNYFKTKSSLKLIKGQNCFLHYKFMEIKHNLLQPTLKLFMLCILFFGKIQVIPAQINTNKIRVGLFSGQVGNGNNLFKNEGITLEESVQLSKCGFRETKRYSPGWNRTSGTHFQISAGINRQSEVYQEFPNLRLNEINKPFTQCGTPVSYVYEIRNNVIDDNVHDINIGYSRSGQTSGIVVNTMIVNDTNTHRRVSNFRVYGGTTFTPQQCASTFNPNADKGSYHEPEKKSPSKNELIDLNFLVTNHERCRLQKGNSRSYTHVNRIFFNSHTIAG